MKAWNLHKVGDICFEDVEMPLLREEEVLIRVQAAGICGSDIPRIYETGAHSMPLIPGHEFAGTVHSIGKRSNSLWIGKRVGIFPLIPCGVCEECKRKKYELCRDYGYIGSRRDGAFAEFVKVPVSNLIELPDNISFEAGAMLEPMAVAVHAIRRGTDNYRLNKEVSIAICGLGTVGSLVLMFLKSAGYDNLFLIGNHDYQGKYADEFGVGKCNFCNETETDVNEWIAEKTDGIDLFFECVGKKETVNFGVNVTSPSGRIVVIGNPYSDIMFEKKLYWKILRNELIVIGTWNSYFDISNLHIGYSEDDGMGGEAYSDDWEYVMKRMREGRIQPEKLITHTLGLEDLDTGLTMMRDKTEPYTKVMIKI